MGRDYDIIINEKLLTVTEPAPSGTTVSLLSLKKGKEYEKKLSTIAKNLVERLLPFFITAEYKCPEIAIEEEDGQDPITLNDWIFKSYHRVATTAWLSLTTPGPA
jgi:hypothetical protein